jgi:hypothetical protein
METVHAQNFPVTSNLSCASPGNSDRAVPRSSTAKYFRFLPNFRRPSGAGGNIRCLFGHWRI